MDYVKIISFCILILSALMIVIVAAKKADYHFQYLKSIFPYQFEKYPSIEKYMAYSFDLSKMKLIFPFFKPERAASNNEFKALIKRIKLYCKVILILFFLIFFNAVFLIVFG